MQPHIAAKGYVMLIPTFFTLPRFYYKQEPDPKKYSPIQFQIKLGCLKNLGTIYYSLKVDPEAAVRVYSQAARLDPKNITLWYRLGLVSSKVVEYELAHSAFQEGLKCNPSHWGCIEHLVTLSYILNDNASCLKFCAIGLSKDSKFIRGLVFRDHIFELQPYLKENLKAVTPNWDTLNVKQEYEVRWKERYLSEARKLLKLQQARNKRIREEEEEERSKVAVCGQSLGSYSFVELCKAVLTFYEEVKSLGVYKT
jgi:tetratricopeptide (TPR) repeat protein